MENDKKRIANEQVFYEYDREISEIKRANFSVESENTKPFDISLMTGNSNSNESEDRGQ